MERYLKWLENKINTCLEDEDLQREHWAFSKAYEKYVELSNSDNNSEEKIMYWAKQLEHKSLSQHELVENVKWLLKQIK